MSDDTTSKTADEPVAEPVPADDIGGLRRRVKLLTWVSAAAILLSLCAVAGSVLSFLGPFGMLGPDMPGRDGSTEEIERSVKDAYGEDLKSVKVREVKYEDMGVPFPYSVMGGGEMEKAYAVEYELRGAPVKVAAVVSAPEELAYTGVIPVQSSLRNRMSLENLMKLMKAFAEKTSEPLGGVTRYGGEMYEGPGQLPETVEVEGTEYRTEELWSAAIGKAPKGEKATVSFMEGDGAVLVFRQDPKTGEFVFLGKEQGMGF